MSTATDVEQLTPAGQRILDVASNLFYEHGIRAVGVDMIAREADVTKKTIYDRFGSKDALVAAYLERQDRRWHALIDEHVNKAGLGPRERILAMFEIMHLQVRERGCGFINAHAEFSTAEHPAMELTTRQKIWTRDFFTQLAREAGVDQPEILGSQLLMLHEGAYVAFAMAGDSDAADHAGAAAGILFDSALHSA